MGIRLCSCLFEFVLMALIVVAPFITDFTIGRGGVRVGLVNSELRASRQSQVQLEGTEDPISRNVPLLVDLNAIGAQARVGGCSILTIHPMAGSYGPVPPGRNRLPFGGGTNRKRSSMPASESGLNGGPGHT